MLKKIILGTVVLAAVSFNVNAQNSEGINPFGVEDHYKRAIVKTPYKVEVCQQITTSGDKTGDTLTGAIIGGIIGNNVTKNLPDGGTAGAIIGGLLGHNNSKATGGTRTVCNIETRYEEEYKEIYSHSTISFVHNGRSYTLRFNK